MKTVAVAYTIGSEYRWLTSDVEMDDRCKRCMNSSESSDVTIRITGTSTSRANKDLLWESQPLACRAPPQKLKLAIQYIDNLKVHAVMKSTTTSCVYPVCILRGPFGWRRDTLSQKVLQQFDHSQNGRQAGALQR